MTSLGPSALRSDVPSPNSSGCVWVKVKSGAVSYLHVRAIFVANPPRVLERVCAYVCMYVFFFWREDGWV